MCSRLVKPIAVLAMSAFTSLAQAEFPLAYHLTGLATYSKIKTAGESFSPSLFNLKADVEITDGLLDGIGLQGVLGAPISSDEQQGLTLEVKNQSAVYITLTNPEYQPGDLRVSVLLGYASTEIETQLPALNSTHQDTFSDFSYGVSLQDRISEGKPLYWTLDCTRSYKDDNLSIDGCGLGVTYAF